MSTIAVNESHNLNIDHLQGSVPGVLFCGGFKSNLQGNKAQHLREFCRRQGWQFTSFDYRGHGHSDGLFEQCTIGDWVEDAICVLDQICTGPQCLIGSSMGAWIGLRVGQMRGERIAGFLGIASAPDFTEQLIWQNLSQSEQDHLASGGGWQLPSHSDDSQEYHITHALIESGRKNSVLTKTLNLPFPVHLLHGTADKDVPWQMSEQLLQHLHAPVANMTLCKGVDHRFSGNPQLQMICNVLSELREWQITKPPTSTEP